ncbi:acyl-CoA dehydrogenase [Nocardioides immobilis]|uniref:Acyl-CoA dehydrogenase n=1 Tax=Nocardioides immobilis TaxID=2049295 RepID=A0A417Y6M9_9ACTN|nr:acyl-CoA dehydrogenase family protein [Nocardioides immobilis]RHW28333.1 acyl-CoA dehydrogenase [Nocardioides immobilis]
MSWVWTEEQDALASALRALLAKNIEPTVEALTGPSTAAGGQVWTRLAAEIGVHAIGIPEEFGGVGSSFHEKAVVFAETGRALAPRGLFSTTALAAPAILLSGDRERCADFLPKLAEGSLSGTVALQEAAGEGSTPSAELVDGTWRVSGHMTHVTDAADVELMLLAARTDQGSRLFAVDLAGDGVTLEIPPCLDLTRPLVEVRLIGAVGVPVGDAGRGDHIIAEVRGQAAVALAFEQLGGAARCVEMATEYALSRTQFGRPIGSFQAIKHLLADVLVAVESASTAAQHAAHAVEREDLDERAEAISVAQILASEAYTAAAGANVQVHGGIGFTWEHPAHLFFRRATVSKAFLGSPSEYREALAAKAFGG